MTIRKKGKWANGESKFVIEDKGKYITTLPQEKELLTLLRLDIPSCSEATPTKDNKENNSKEFVYCSLSEHQKQDANQTPPVNGMSTLLAGTQSPPAGAVNPVHPSDGFPEDEILKAKRIRDELIKFILGKKDGSKKKT